MESGHSLYLKREDSDEVRRGGTPAPDGGYRDDFAIVVPSLISPS